MSLRKKVNQQLKMLSQRDDINYQFMQECTGYNAITFRRLLNKETKTISLDILCKLEEAGLINFNIDGKGFNKEENPMRIEKTHKRGQTRREMPDKIEIVKKPIEHVESLIDFEDNVTKGKRYKTLTVTDNGTAIIIDNEGARFELLKDEYKPL